MQCYSILITNLVKFRHMIKNLDSDHAWVPLAYLMHGYRLTQSERTASGAPAPPCAPFHSPLIIIQYIDRRGVRHPRHPPACICCSFIWNGLARGALINPHLSRGIPESILSSRRRQTCMYSFLSHYVLLLCVSWALQLTLAERK